MSEFDKWLQRFTSGSQVILVIIAIFTIYYSVIPLYQKELASEQLARIQMEQFAAEERLNFLNAGYELKLKEIDGFRSEIESLTYQSKEERFKLEKVISEIERKDALLSGTNKLLASARGEMEKTSLKLINSHKLKFVQVLDWYTLIEPLDEKCDKVLSEWSRPDDDPLPKPDSVGCNPYETIKLAIYKVQQPKAKDASGDELFLPVGYVRKWSGIATKLMKDNEALLVDNMDYSHRDELIRRADVILKKPRAKEDDEAHAREYVQASLAVLNYEGEARDKNSSAIKVYMRLLREKLN